MAPYYDFAIRLSVHIQIVISIIIASRTFQMKIKWLFTWWTTSIRILFLNKIRGKNVCSIISADALKGFQFTKHKRQSRTFVKK